MTWSPWWASRMPTQVPVVTTVPAGTVAPSRVAWRNQAGSPQVGRPKGCEPLRSTTGCCPTNAEEPWRCSSVLRTELQTGRQKFHAQWKSLTVSVNQFWRWTKDSCRDPRSSCSHIYGPIEFQYGADSRFYSRRRFLHKLPDQRHSIGAAGKAALSQYHVRQR